MAGAVWVTGAVTLTARGPEAEPRALRVSLSNLLLVSWTASWALPKRCWEAGVGISWKKVIPNQVSNLYLLIAFAEEMTLKTRGAEPST